MESMTKLNLKNINAKFFCLLALPFVLASCNTLQDVFKLPFKKAPTQYAEPAVASTVAEISDKWWENYQDQKLNELVQLALDKNSDIKVATARIEEADSFAREVGTSILPTVNLGAGAAKQRTFIPGFNGINPTFNLYQIGLSTNYEIDVWGKIKLAEKSARAQLLASKYALDTSKISVASLVTSYYLSLLSLDAQQNVLSKILESREKSLALARKRLQGGIVSILDIYQAEGAILQIKLQQEEYKRLRAIAAHQLLLLTASADVDIQKYSLETLPDVPVPPAGLPSSLLTARPDIQISELELISMQANIGFARAAFYPSFSFVGSGGLQSAVFSDFIRNPARVFTLGFDLNLPIFDGGKRKEKLNQTLAQEKQSLERYANTINIAFKEVNDSLSNVQQEAEKERLLKEATALAAKTVEVARNRYEAGYTSYIELLDAERSLIETNVTYLQTREARLLASVSLFKALGGGWRAQNSLEPTKVEAIKSESLAEPKTN
jgi:outer membrane protein, multidrug efflux system